MEPQTPQTWQEALKLWDAGEPLAVFQVESEGATQTQLWGWAFDCLRGDTEFSAELPVTKREIAVVNSIFNVAKSESWARMIQRHVDPQKSPAITIQKPKS